MGTQECITQSIATAASLNFRRPALSDKPWMDELLSEANYMGCEHAFGAAYIWSYHYGTHVARFEDFLLVRGKRSFSFPAGRGDLTVALHVMKDFADAQSQPLVLHGVCGDMMPALEEAFPGYFEYRPQRDSFDYIYNAQDLSLLSGKKYHGKRNHISKFSREHEWQYEDITAENLNECLEVGQLWCREKSGVDCTVESDPEFCAIYRAFRHYFELEFKGGLIRVDGRVVAFTCGERLNQDTFVIHFEKTLPGFEGAYPVINNQFAAHNLSDYRYINREEDLGIEGLRKAKLSYKPEILLEKHLAVPKDAPIAL